MTDHKTQLAVLAATALMLAPACRNTAQGVKEDTRQNTERAQQDAQVVKQQSREAAQEIGEKAGEVGGKISEGAKDVGELIHEGAKAAGSEVGAKKQTIDVEAALVVDPTIDASHVDVDTDADTKTVTLKGSVPTTAQKAAVEKVARDKAEGYAIRNLLTVVPKP